MGFRFDPGRDPYQSSERLGLESAGEEIPHCALSYAPRVYLVTDLQQNGATLAVIGIVLISGYTNQVHLGQSAFVGVGAYTSAVLMTKFGLNFWVTIPCAILLAALMGIVLGIPALKVVGGPYLAMVTMIFGEIIYLVILNWEDVTGGSFGINRIPAPSIGPISLQSKTSLLILAAILFIIAFFVARRLVQSKYGRFFLSIKESEAAAQSVGVNTMKYKIMAFSLSSAFAGVAGILYAQCFSYLSAEQFRWSNSLTLISMAIIGGIASLEGGTLGAIILMAHGYRAVHGPRPHDQIPLGDRRPALFGSDC